MSAGLPFRCTLVRRQVRAKTPSNFCALPMTTTAVAGKAEWNQRADGFKGWPHFGDTGSCARLCKVFRLRLLPSGLFDGLSAARTDLAPTSDGIPAAEVAAIGLGTIAGLP